MPPWLAVAGFQVSLRFTELRSGAVDCSVQQKSHEAERGRCCVLGQGPNGVGGGWKGRVWKSISFAHSDLFAVLVISSLHHTEDLGASQPLGKVNATAWTSKKNSVAMYRSAEIEQCGRRELFELPHLPQVSHGTSEIEAAKDAF